MTKYLYDKAREKYLNGDLDWANDDIKAVLVDTALYTVNASTHEFLADIAAGARIATSPNLTGKTSTAGVANAASPTTFSAVTGAQSEALALYKDTGSAATSPLILYTDEATGLPVLPNGGDISITWNTGAEKIFKL